MTDILSFFWAALFALLAENILFSRGIGIAISASVGRDSLHVLFYSLGVTVFSLVAAVPAWFLCLLLKELGFYPAIEPLCFTLVLTGLHLLVYFGLRAASKVYYPRYSAEITHMIFNCVTMSVMLIGVRERLDLGSALLFALFTGLGFLVASMFLLEGQRRLSAAKLPESFAGIPALLIYVGILSMAIYGFTGGSSPF